MSCKLMPSGENPINYKMHFTSLDIVIVDVKCFYNKTVRYLMFCDVLFVHI